MFIDRAPDAASPVSSVTPISRRAPRIAFDMLVRYAWRGQRATALVKDLTRFGARIEGLQGLRKGDWLTVLLPDLQPIDAEVAWAEGQSAGLAFADAVPASPFDELVRNFAAGGPRTPGGRPGGFSHAA